MTTTTRRRRWFAGAAAVLLGFTGVLFGAGPAWAAPWTGYIYGGPSPSSSGHFEYDWTVSSAAGGDYLRLQSYPLSLASGKCHDMLFDWNPGGGHYDGRLARSCKAGVQRDTNVSHEDPHNLIGVQRLGTCYGTNQDTNGAGSVCNFTIGGPAGMVTLVGPLERCVRAWSMKPDGTSQFFGGGNPIQCGT